jgi:TonB-dependent SusC/RagA subfamily outer membrane receptor
MNFITNGNAMPNGLVYFEDASQIRTKKRYISQALKRKIVIQLKLITFLLFVFLIQVKGAGFAQPISLKEKNASIEQILQTIERQSGYVFFYNNRDVRNLKASIFLKNASIEHTLQETFRGLPLAYKIIDNTVVIRKTDTPLKTPVGRGDKQIRKTEIEVKGQVLDEKGEGLPGVSIRVKGSNEGTTSDVEGNFNLKVSDEGNAVLMFSFIGYVPQEVPITNQTALKIVMQIDNKALDEVVVVGYGTQKKANVVSSISSVNGSQITFPTRNLTNNLAGQMAGLMSIQRTGEPGRDDAEFWIRGVSTFAGGTAPLVLVDGVPRSFSNIEPDEIETFSVLKDAAATAVYGAEGAMASYWSQPKEGALVSRKSLFGQNTAFPLPRVYQNLWSHGNIWNWPMKL